MEIRLARHAYADAIEGTYDELFAYEAEHGPISNWQAGVYPTRATVDEAIVRGWMWVGVEGGAVLASMILNNRQPPEYESVRWSWRATPEKVLVIRTLVVPPSAAGRGYGSAMLDFALDWGHSHGRRVCRLDTWVGNKPAQALYQRADFRIAGKAPMKLAGLIDEEQVFLERQL